MLSSGILLSTDMLLGKKDTKFVHGVINQSIDACPYCTPVIYDNKCMEQGNKQSHISVGVLMAPRGNCCLCPTTLTVADKSNIMPTDLQPLCNSHKVITSDRFDITRFDGILSDIKRLGAVSIVMGKEGGRKVADYVREVGSVFRYSSLFSSFAKAITLRSKSDRELFVLTFLDLPYCIPIYDTSATNGIGLIVTRSSMERSISNQCLFNHFRYEFVMSDDEINLFKADFGKIDANESTPSGALIEINELSKIKLPVSTSSQERKKREQMPPQFMETDLRRRLTAAMAPRTSDKKQKGVWGQGLKWAQPSDIWTTHEVRDNRWPTYKAGEVGTAYNSHGDPAEVKVGPDSGGHERTAEIGVVPGRAFTSDSDDEE
jgi:hypothetical protein